MTAWTAYMSDAKVYMQATYLSVLQSTIHVNLAFRNVASQIGDWVRDVVIGHSQDGKLGDGTIAALHSTGTLVDGGQIRVHVTRVGATARHLFARCRHFSQSICV